MKIRLFLIQKRLVYALILCALFSCGQQNSSTTPISVSVNPETDKRWNELKPYDVQYDGNNIILTVNVPVYIKSNYYPSGNYVHIGNPAKGIYDHLISRFRKSGTRHLYVSFYNGERDKYGNRVFPDAKYAMSLQLEEVKKYQSADYFDQAYEISKLINEKVAQNISDYKSEQISRTVPDYMKNEAENDTVQQYSTPQVTRNVPDYLKGRTADDFMIP